MLTPHGLADDVCGFLGPNERSGVLIPVLNVLEDVSHEGTHGVEGTATNRLARQNTEPRFDQIDPRSSRGSEVKVDLGVLVQPGPNRLSAVRRRVVEDHVEIATPITPRHALNKLQKVGAGVSLATLSDDAAIGYLQGGVQAGQSVALIVMRLPRRQPL